jgi:hypothetical protein
MGFVHKCFLNVLSLYATSQALEAVAELCDSSTLFPSLPPQRLQLLR